MPGTGIPNPTGVTGWDGVAAALTGVGEVVGQVTVVAAVASLVVRFRRSHGRERAQLKWFLYGAALLVSGLLFAGLASGPVNELSFVAALVGMTAVPAVVGVAILEHHLYDIDRVINRTVVYGALTVALAGVYVGTAAAAALVFDRALTVGASLLATVVVIVALQPVRERLERGVGRLVYGHRRDPAGRSRPSRGASTPPSTRRTSPSSSSAASSTA